MYSTSEDYNESTLYITIQFVPHNEHSVRQLERPITERCIGK
jgi:hypothetical protein